MQLGSPGFFGQPADPGTANLAARQTRRSAATMKDAWGGEIIVLAKTGGPDN
jgi:hypothetical protein